MMVSFMWQIKPVQAVALPFSDGLESGDTSNFDSITETGGGDVSVTSSVKYAGTYAANCSSNADDGEASLNVVVNSKVIVAQTMFNIAKNITRVGNGGACNTLSFSGTDSLGATLCYIYFYGEWRWRLDLGGSADWVNNYTKDLTMSASNWYQLTLIYNVTGEFVRFFINDTLTYQWTGLDDIGNVTQVRFRCNPYDTTGDDSVSIFDNIAVDDDDILSNLIDDNPAFSGLWIDKVQISQNTNIAIKWTQDSRSATNLNVSVFSWNSTGPYVNTTLSISGHSAWHNFSKTNNDTASTVVGIKLYCNNTDNEWTTTEFAFTTMSDAMMLHNVNGVLKDEAGKAVYLRGTGHIHGYTDDAAGGWIRENGLIADSYTNDYAEDKILDNLKFMSVWGIDHIRFHVNTAWWEVGNITDDGHTVDVRYAIKRLSILAAQYGLYLIMDNFDLDIDNSTGFVNWWGNVTEELRYYSNIVFEIRNEPSPTDGNRDAWMATMQDVIDRIRSVGASNPIILMGSGATVPNSVLGWKMSMEWALPEHYNFTDAINDNLVLSGHLYRTWMNPCWHDDWNYTLLYEDMEDTYFRQVQETTHRPVIVGEIGVNMWESDSATEPESGMTNQTEETTWAYNVFAYCNNFSLGYSAWNWIPNGGDQWYQHSGVSFQPSKWGIALIQGINFDEPFVWTVGTSINIYSNNTSWSSSWNSGAKQLSVSVTGSGSAKLRVFWNVSSTYAVNSTLKVNFGNGTVVDFEDYFNSTTNLGVFPLSLSTLTITIGYNMDGAPSVGSPSASTAVEASTCTISCTMTDDVGLVSGILSTNSTNAWVNNTAKTLSGLSYAFSDSVVLPSAGTIFGYKIFVSDSAGQWTTSSTYTFITTSQGSTPSQNKSSSGYSRFLCMFTVSSNGRALQDLKIRLWENNYSVLIETLQTDSEGYVETELPSGTYEYSADFGGQTKRGYVLLDDAKKITIDFDSAQKSTFDRSSLIKVSFALVVVACAIVAILAVKNRH